MYRRGAIAAFILLLTIGFARPDSITLKRLTKYIDNAGVDEIVACDSSLSGVIFVTADGADATDCTVGGAAFKNLCYCNGTAWVIASSGGGGSSVITDLTGTAWQVFYTDGSGNVTELGLGASGTFLKSNGATSIPSFATPAGSGDVTKVLTPLDDQVGVWTGDGTIEGTTGLTYDGSTFATTGNITVTGTVDGVDILARDHAATTDTGPSPDCSGATTYQNGEAGCVDIELVYANLGANGDITSLNALTTDITVLQGGTGASDAATARTNLGVDVAGTDNSTDVTLAGTPDYITLSGQILTRTILDTSDDTNLAVTAPIVLTDDTISIDEASAYTWIGDHDFVAGGIEPENRTLATLATCTDGQIAYVTDATVGQRLYACESGTFAEQGDGGGGGGDSVSIDGVAATDPDFRSEGDLDAIRCTGASTPDASCVAGEDVIYRYNSGSIVNADVNASAAIAISKTALAAGTNITLATDTLNVDDAFLVNDASDVMAGTLTADGLTLGANENITLGAQTLDHDGTDFVFNDSVAGTSFTADASDTAAMTLTTATLGAQVSIGITEAAGPESIMDINVDTGTGTPTQFIEVDGVNNDIELGTPGTNYVDITTAGVMSFTGTGDILLPLNALDNVDELDTGLCTGSQILKKNVGNTAWECAADSGSSFDAGLVDDETWSDGLNASNTWTFSVSGTNPVVIWGNGTVDYSTPITATTFVADASAAPSITFDDSIAAGTEAQITADASVDNNGQMFLQVEDAAAVYKTGLSIVSTGGAVVTKIGGDAASANHVALDESGLMTFAGTAGITLPNDTITTAAQIDSTLCAADEVLKQNGTGTGWGCLADATGGTPTFTSITTGTNTAAGGLFVGSAGSLSATGTGTIVATGVDAVTTGAILIGSADVTEITIDSDGIAGTVTESGLTLLADDTITLTTETTGNYVDDITASQGLLLTGTEGATVGLIDCAENEILKSTGVGGTSWTCQADNGGTETNTLTDVLTGIIDDQFVIGGAAVATYDTVPDCDLAGNALTYDTTANNVDCATGYITNGESLGGELGGTIASATINDTITVTGWTMGASAGTTPSVDDSGTSLATTLFVQNETVAAGDVTGTIGGGLTIGTGVVDINELAADLNFADNDSINMSGITLSTTGEGFINSVSADCSAITGLTEGTQCYDTATDAICVFGSDNVMDCQVLGASGSGFGALTTGTNTGAAMTVAAGAEILVTSTADVEATQVTMPATTSAGTASIAVSNVVYISNVYDISNGCVEVELADNDGAGTMPAIGIVSGAINDGDCNGEITVSGFLDGIEMGAFTAGDSLYVGSTAGVVTSTKPTGASELIQKVGQVAQNTGSGDRVQVFGAGRSNDVPNAITLGTNDSIDGTIEWTGTSILETGVAFQFGDGTDATLTHTYGNTGTDVTVAYSTAAMDVTGTLTATTLAADASATPSILLQDTGNGGTESSIEMTDFTGPEAKMQLRVDTGTGSLTTFVEIDGVNDAVDFTVPVTATSYTADSSPAATTDSTLVATTAYVKNQEHTVCKTVESLVVADDAVPLFHFNAASTITKIGCDSRAATTVSLQDATPTDVDADLVCSTGGAITWDSSFTGTATFTDGEQLQFDTITESTPDWTTICFAYTTP